MNKGSMVKTGWLSMLKNEKLLLVHSRNVNNIARFKSHMNNAPRQERLNMMHTEYNPKGI